MKNQTIAIRKMVAYLNNEEEEGGFWLPNIQRPFVWNEGQIERLFDSLMREYPISTLLVWKTKDKIRCREFIKNYQHGIKLAHYYVPENGKKKMVVLDGQQRLQSLFIGLCGSYDGRELYLDILSGGEAMAPEDMCYRFKFMHEKEARVPWIKFKDIVFGEAKRRKNEEEIISRFSSDVTDAQEGRISENIDQIFHVFIDEDAIVYQELDSIDGRRKYIEDDVVEVFIRANSGGTHLGKSDLLFSLLTSSWVDAIENVETLLDDLNRTGFEFDRDFILKTCLTLIGTGASYNVLKFRDEKNREEIIQNWDGISNAIRDVKDFVHGKTFIRHHKAMVSYLTLIPLIYYRYKYPDAWRLTKDLDIYLLRSLLVQAFSGRPDNVIDRCTAEIDRSGAFDVKNIFTAIRADGRSLDVTPDTLFDEGYGSKLIHLIFNLWYRDFDYEPAFSNNNPQIDHIFPRSLLRKQKKRNPDSGRMDMLKYGPAERNQLANCMLLTASENGAGGKANMPPYEWFDGDRKEDEYLDMHLIPKDPELWHIERYDDFIEQRKKLIEAKFGYLIFRDQGDAVDNEKLNDEIDKHGV